MGLRRFITARPWLYSLAKRGVVAAQNGPIRWRVVDLIQPKRYSRMTGPLGQDIHCLGIGHKALAIWRRKPWED